MRRSSIRHQVFFVLSAWWTFGCGDRGASDETEPGDPTAMSSQDVNSDGSLPQVVINEFVASNATGAVDEGGGTGDWIELYNLSDELIELDGFFVSDDADIPTKGLLSGGLVIEPRGTLLLWADSDIEQGPHHLPFNLKKDGESILLTSNMGDLLDSIDYENATTDSSFARVPDGTGDFAICATPTPDAGNDPACEP